MEEQMLPRPAKARRRILSCENCRRLKSRCEYNPRVNSCQRCHKLRIRCSLQSEQDTFIATASPSHDVADDATDNRIANVERSLASVKASVDKIWEFLQQNAAPSVHHPIGHSPAGAESITDHGLRTYANEQLDAADFPPLHTPRGDVSASAPIMVVRRFRSSKRRLYEEEGRDVITLGILTENVAEKLVSEFIFRLGRFIQVRALADLTPAQSLRLASPLLHAVCCLQSLRFFKGTDLVSENGYRRLYEEVRKMLGQLVLASPVPIEELYAMLIMCTFEAAPRPVFEYIESWHLSGICAQQAISAINFAEILANLSRGKHESQDKRCLSLWNNICLVHLRFAVGTGKPATIPPDLLEQCPAILNHPHATIDDGIVLAEVLLFGLCSKQAPLLLDSHGHCQELAVWERRWEHLLKSENAIYLKFGYEFAYLVLAMRSVEKCQSHGQGHAASPDSRHSQEERLLAPAHDIKAFQAIAYKHALAMARIFLQMPPPAVQELPKFHHICIAYSSIVISECTGATWDPPEDALKILSDVCIHYRQFSDELPAVMHVALEKMRHIGHESSIHQEKVHRLRFQTGYTEGNGTGSFEDQDTGSPSHVHNPPIARGLAGRVDAEQYTDVDLPTVGLEVTSFPTVDDFFTSWMMETDME